MQVYCIRDVKFGFQAMLVLLHVILHDLFPDPDVVMSFNRLDTATFLVRFNNMIVELLIGTVVDNQRIGDTRLCKDLAQCLRIWTYTGKHSQYAPETSAHFLSA